MADLSKVFMGCAFGAAIGGALGFVAHTMKKHKDQLNDLGYDWVYAKTNPQIAQELYSLKGFKHADEESYQQIGAACDSLISLWYSVTDPAVPPQHAWMFKAYQYRFQVEKGLQEFSKKILVCKKVSRRRRHGDQSPQDEDEKKTDYDEFCQHADVLCTAVQNYHHNIVSEMQQKNALTWKE